MNIEQEFRLRSSAVIGVLIAIAMLILACNVGSFFAPTPMPVAPSPIVTSVARVTTAPTKIARPTPTWWDAQIRMPAGAEFVGDSQRAEWSTRDTNADGIKNYLAQQADAAGYQTFLVTNSQGAIYDVLCVKGQNAFAVNITLGSDATIITVNRTGVMRLKVSGVANVEIDLPMRSRVDVAPGSEISIGTMVPTAQCAGCEYFINVHIAPFKGVGSYDSKPGISIIDIELVPGGDHDRDNFRWAIGGCTVDVKATGGSFDCKQLQNIIDQSKRVDVSGTWTQSADGK